MLLFLLLLLVLLLLLLLQLLLLPPWLQLSKPASLAKLRNEINNELEKATRRLASQTKKAQKMWTKVQYVSPFFRFGT